MYAGGTPLTVCLMGALIASGDHSRSYVYASPSFKLLLMFVISKWVAHWLALRPESDHLHASALIGCFKHAVQAGWDFHGCNIQQTHRMSR